MAKRISKIRELLKEEDALKDEDIKKLEKELEAELKAEEAGEEDEEWTKAESAEDTEVEDESEVEEEADEDEEDKELQVEDDEEDVEAAEKVSDEVDSEEEPEAAVDADEDDLEKEFDINDSSDVFLDDEEEEVAAEAKEEDEDKELQVEDDEEDEDEEKEVEECEDKKEVKKPSLDVEEHVQALFNGEQLTEEFQSKARTIFEAAVRDKVIQFSKTLKERYNKRLRAAKAKIEERMISKIDGYMDYVVEEWMEQNKLAVDHGLRTEITEEFITDLRSLFEAHNIMIPKGKENLVESLASKVEKLEKDLNDEIKKNIAIRKKLNEHKKNEVFREICEGLADTEIEKLKSLASSIDYDDSYRNKLLIIKENYFSQKTKKAGTVEEIAENKITESETEFVDDTMASYLNIMGKIR